jgi:anti-sigma factor RsiW
MISEHPDDIILLDYVEGMLQGQASDSVRRHIATCRACRRTLAELSDTVSELERLPTAEIPHDALGRPGRAGMLRALARFVPVVLAATALVCAILFTRSGTGRRHNSPPKTVTRSPGVMAAVGIPLGVFTVQELGQRQRNHDSVKYARVTRSPASDGFVVNVPISMFDKARAALHDIAEGSQCATRPDSEDCDRVVLFGVRRRTQTQVEPVAAG